MIRRSVYVRHLIVSGLLMLGMLILMGRSRVPAQAVDHVRPVSQTSAPAQPKGVPAAITLSANLPD
jgi:hypothetical protein